MYRVTHDQLHDTFRRLGADAPVSSVEGYTKYKLIRQVKNTDEICFAKTAAQYYGLEINLEVYLDRLISHLEVDAGRHTFDNAKSTKLDELLAVDLISGAV